MRVVIAEDNYLLRQGIERLLTSVDDIEVVASAGAYDELLAAVDEQRPDAVLTDIPTGTTGEGPPGSGPPQFVHGMTQEFTVS